MFFNITLPQFIVKFVTSHSTKYSIDVYEEADLAPNQNSSYDTIVLIHGFTGHRKNCSLICQHLAN